MKLKKLPKIKVRNHVALSPLLQKGGMHDAQKPKVQHKRDRKQAKQMLKNYY